MVDVDTFLTTLYVMVDDFCMLALPPVLHPGPQAALSRSEVVTLALFGQWQGFGSERGFLPLCATPSPGRLSAAADVGAVQSADSSAAAGPGGVFSVSRPPLGRPALCL